MVHKKPNHSPRIPAAQGIQNYQLKHRVSGAAIIIGAAVVMIPLFLNEPNVALIIAQEDASFEESSAFQSRVQPLDNANNPALLPSSKLVDGDSDSAASQTQSTKLVLTFDSGAEKQPESDVDVAEKQPESDADVSETQPDSDADVAEKKPESDADVDVAEKQSAADQTAKKVIESGWIVQAGVFFEKENVESVSKSLKDNGFEVKLMQVQKKLGQATQIWLGPYKDKKAAEKISAHLKKLTGEKGYVRKYAS